VLIFIGFSHSSAYRSFLKLSFYPYVIFTRHRNSIEKNIREKRHAAGQD
jgi:hypothetical protein